MPSICNNNKEIISKENRLNFEMKVLFGQSSLTFSCFDR